MSRDREWTEAESAEVAARALSRIADTLDDYMDLSLSAQEVIGGARAAEPEMVAALGPLLDTLADIRSRRASR